MRKDSVEEEKDMRKFNIRFKEDRMQMLVKAKDRFGL